MYTLKQKTKNNFRFVVFRFMYKLKQKRKTTINIRFLVFRFMYKLKQITKNENQLSFYRFLFFNASWNEKTKNEINSHIIVFCFVYKIRQKKKINFCFYRFLFCICLALFFFKFQLRRSVCHSSIQFSFKIKNRKLMSILDFRYILSQKYDSSKSKILGSFSFDKILIDPTFRQSCLVPSSAVI